MNTGSPHEWIIPQLPPGTVAVLDADPAAQIGRPFTATHERALWPTLRVAAGRLGLGPESLVIAMPECPLPVGVPDLVVAVGDPGTIFARLKETSLSVRSEQEARLVAACGPRRPATLEGLASACAVSPQHTRRLISGLVGRGVLLESGNGWLRHELMRPVLRCYALEAKATDWHAGVWQCLRYSSYAGASGLIVDPKSRDTIHKVATAGRTHGVGVFIGDRWLSRPRMHRLPLARQLWVSEHVIATLSARLTLTGTPQCDMAAG